MVALPFIAMGLAAAGTAVSVVGSIQQANYKKALANQNAQLAIQNANTAALRGESERATLARMGSDTIGKQRAMAGVSGADVQSGSLVDVLASTRFLNQYDIAKSGWNTQMEQRGYEIQSSNFKAQGDLAGAEGRYGAMSSLLTGAASIAGSASKMSGGGADLKNLLYEANSFDNATFPKIGP